MNISDDCDFEVVNSLRHQIQQTITASEFTHKEILIALQKSIGVLFTIPCPGCRRVTKKSIEKSLPQILRYVMKEAAQQPQSSGHIH